MAIPRRQRQPQEARGPSRQRAKSRKAIEAEESRAEEAAAAAASKAAAVLRTVAKKGAKELVSAKNLRITSSSAAPYDSRAAMNNNLITKEELPPAPSNGLQGGEPPAHNEDRQTGSMPALPGTPESSLDGPTVRTLFLRLLCDIPVRGGVNVRRLAQSTCWAYCQQMLQPRHDAMLVPDLKDFEAKNDATRVIQWIVERYTGCVVPAKDVTSRDAVEDRSDEGATSLFYLSSSSKGEECYKATKHFMALLAGKEWPPSLPQLEDDPEANHDSPTRKVLKPLSSSQQAVAKRSYCSAVGRKMGRRLTAKETTTAADKQTTGATVKQSITTPRSPPVSKKASNVVLSGESVAIGVHYRLDARSRKRKQTKELNGVSSTAAKKKQLEAYPSKTKASRPAFSSNHTIPRLSCDRDTTFEGGLRFEALVKVAVERFVQSEAEDRAAAAVMSSMTPPPERRRHAVTRLIDSATTPTHLLQPLAHLPRGQLLS